MYFPPSHEQESTSPFSLPLSIIIFLSFMKLPSIMNLRLIICFTLPRSSTSCRYLSTMNLSSNLTSAPLHFSWLVCWHSSTTNNRSLCMSVTSDASHDDLYTTRKVTSQRLAVIHLWYRKIKSYFRCALILTFLQIHLPHAHHASNNQPQQSHLQYPPLR